MAAEHYDFRLRHAAVQDGEWVPFALAFTGRMSITGLYTEPRRFDPIWILDPLDPDPVKGHWGGDQWYLDVLCVDDLLGHTGAKFAKSGLQMVQDLRQFRGLPIMDFEDVDRVIYSVLFTSYTEAARVPWEQSNPQGGFVVRLRLSYRSP